MRETAEFAAFITTTESAAVALGDGDAKALSRRLIPVTEIAEWHMKMKVRKR